MNAIKLERRIEALEAQGRRSLQSLSDEELTARILGLIPQVGGQRIGDFSVSETELFLDGIQASLNNQPVSAESAVMLERFGLYP